MPEVSELECLPSRGPLLITFVVRPEETSLRSLPTEIRSGSDYSCPSSPNDNHRDV